MSDNCHKYVTRVGGDTLTNSCKYYHSQLGFYRQIKINSWLPEGCWVLNNQIYNLTHFAIQKR